MKQSKYSSPKVSVVIPTYNRHNLIARAIDSVLQQTFEDFEVIVVDDASTDDTVAIVKSVADNRVRLIQHETNLGGSDARNTGVEAARGEYVSFLDSDDTWHPEKIAVQVKAIEGCSRPQITVCYTRFEHDVASDVVVFPRRALGIDERVATYLFCGDPGDGVMMTSSIMASRQLLRDVKFKAGLQRHQDLDLCIRLDAFGAKFLFLERSLVQWRNCAAEDRISRSKSYKPSLDWIQSMQPMIESEEVAGFLGKWVFHKIPSSSTGLIETLDVIHGLVPGGLSPEDALRILVGKRRAIPSGNYDENVKIEEILRRLGEEHSLRKAIQSSHSWRLTAPLRAVSRFVRRTIADLSAC